MPIVLCVSGVGTDIGKTHVATALVRVAGAAGIRAVGLKPIESGGGADGQALGRASTFHVKHPPPYCFEEPVSPHLAARHRDTQIDLERCASWCKLAANEADLVVVELPGALLTPLAPRSTNADLLRILACDHWILVAVDRLGVLHDVRAALLAAESHELPAPLVALNAPACADASTGTNASELEALGICRVRAEFPRSPREDTSTLPAQRLLCAAGVPLNNRPP